MKKSTPIRRTSLTFKRPAGSDDVLARFLGLAGLAVGLAVGIAVGFAAPAQAHNYLVSSTPAEGETLTELPEQFIITTNDAMLDLAGESGGFALQVTDSAGLFYGDGCVVIDGASMFAEAALGAPGDYTLAWQAISADGHTIFDEFAFSWQPTTDAEAAADAEASASAGRPAAPVCGEAAGEEPEQTSSPSPSAAAETPAEPAGDSAASDLLWIGGAAGAVVIAAVVTLLLLRRKLT